MNSPFLGNVVVITGASTGIGKHIALQLANKGASVALAARDADRLSKVRDQCESLGGKAIAIPTDVSAEQQCQMLIEATVDEFGGVDTLVNNAGITMWTYFDQIQDLRIIENIMQVNYLGSVYCTHHALPYLKKARGRLVGISSLTGKTGVPTRSGYAASKHAMVGFFDSLRIELAESGVTVTMIYPGFVATEARERALGSDGKSLGQSPVDETKFMTAEKCAELIVNAVAKRKRELVMTFKGKLGPWAKLIVPRVVDKIAKRSIEKGK